MGLTISVCGVDLEPNEAIYGGVIKALAQSGQMEEALQLYHDMQHMNVMPNVIICNTMLSGYAKKGSWQSSKQFLYEMQSRYGVYPNTISYR